MNQFELKCIRFIRSLAVACGILVACLLLSRSVAAQQFELATPDGLNRSTASLDRTGLLITDAAGVLTVYERERRYDTADGQYEGYFSRAINRAVRWPTAGRGSMQLADLNDRNPRFRVSQMAVTPIGSPGGPSGFGPSGQGPSGQGSGGQGSGAFRSFKPMITHQHSGSGGRSAAAAAQANGRGKLTTEDAMNVGLVLQADTRLPVEMAPDASNAGQYWVILPVTRDVVRLQLVRGGRLWSLSATGPTGPVILANSQQDTAQLWRAVDRAGVLRFDSVAYPGRSLAGGADGLVALERTSDGEAQHWLASFAAPPPTLVLPSVRLTLHEMRPNPAIPPANVRLVNSHRSEVTVVIQDLRTGQTVQTFQIPAGQFIQTQLQRDPGGVIVERYDVQTPGGFISSDETITPVPPSEIYDIRVYERYLQSIAIDRTGKSPNAIEDINYQRKGVGTFLIPAGPQLSDGATIDVYRQAKEMQNPGALQPLQQQDSSSSRQGPLYRTLEELGVPQP